MPLGLGNNLIRSGGAGNPDGLSLDLQFAADKMLSARRGPTPVLIRSQVSPTGSTYVGSDGLIKYADNNEPRFDHGSITPFACKGLLIEEQRTNLYSRSDDFADSTWVKLQASIQTNITTAPDGSMTADKLIEDTTASSIHNINVAVTPPTTPHTLSVFAKKGERDFIVLRLGGTNDFFNLNTGVALTNVNLPTITNYGNGWYRCTVTSSGGTQGHYRISADGITDTYTGDGTSGIFIWGAQLEAGSFATSYIPTTTASVVRSADVCSITGANFTSFYNQPEFSLFCEAISASHASFPSYVSLDNGTASEQAALSGFPSPNSIVCYVIDNNVTQSNTNRNITLNQTNKMAAGFKQNSFQIALNNSLGTEDVIGTMPTATIFNIGRSWNGLNINGTITSIRYYKKRLPNVKLQSLTA